MPDLVHISDYPSSKDLAKCDISSQVIKVSFENCDQKLYLIRSCIVAEIRMTGAGRIKGRCYVLKNIFVNWWILLLE